MQSVNLMVTLAWSPKVSKAPALSVLGSLMWLFPSICCPVQNVKDISHMVRCD